MGLKLVSLPDFYLPIQIKQIRQIQLDEDERLLPFYFL